MAERNGFSDHSNEELILELIKRNGVDQAPRCTVNDGSFIECLVADRNDHAIRIIIPKDAPAMAGTAHDKA